VRVIVFGAGAVGGLLAAKLLGGDREVVAIARLDDVVVVRSRGLQVTGRTEGTFEPSAFDALVMGMEADAVVLTVKSYDVYEAARQIGRFLPSHPPVLALQNGLGIEERVLEGLRAEGSPTPGGRVTLGISTVAVTRRAPGELFHAADGEVILPNPTEPGAKAAADRFEGLLRSGGFSVRRVGEFARERWRKVIVNAAINPVTADHDILNGQLAKDPWRGQAETLLREAQAVAEAEGISFDDSEIEGDLWRIVRATATNVSSMLQDVRRDHRTEVESITGEILRRGVTHGLELPASRRVYDRLKARERAGPPGEQRS
jgi:2-dehydropantoate 2-reductase